MNVLDTGHALDQNQLFSAMGRDGGEVRKNARWAIHLPTPTIDKLRAEARRRGCDAEELAEAILKNVVTDSLYAAVIDL